VAELSRRDEAVIVTIEDLATVSPSFLEPLTQRERTLNASRISSSESVSFIFLAIMVRNSSSFVRNRMFFFFGR